MAADWVIYNAAQDRVAELQAVDDGTTGHLFIYAAGRTKPQVMLGMNEVNTGHGVLEVSADDGMTQITGKGVVIGDRDRHPVALPRRTDDSGWLKLWSAGLPATELWTGRAGSGISVYGPAGGSDSTEARQDSTDQGGGAMSAAEAITIESQAGGLGKMTFLANGKPRTTLGVSVDDAGLIRLDGANGNSVEMHAANGSFRSLNATRSDIAVMGLDPNGSGIIDVRHKSGVGGVRLDVSETGAGNLKIHAPPFEIKAQIGTKGEKGDMCVEGGKGLICLSGVAIKSLILW